MKEILKKYKFVVILVIVVLIVSIAYLVKLYMLNTEVYIESYLNGEEYIMNEKKYGVNEYSPINITEEQMASIYLNDFKNQIFNDVNYAYTLLNEKYRNLKFGSVDNFINYINQINFKDMIIESYSINQKNDTITVYTKDEKIYIFKIISVMEYEVYLDETTLEI